MQPLEWKLYLDLMIRNNQLLRCKLNYQQPISSSFRRPKYGLFHSKINIKYFNSICLIFVLMQQSHLCRNRLINWVCACWSQQKDPLDPFNPSHLDSTDLRQHQLLLVKAAELSLSTADNVLANIAHKIPEKELNSIFSTKLYLFKCQLIKTLAVWHEWNLWSKPDNKIWVAVCSRAT